MKPTHNAAISVKCPLLKHVVTSAAESECGALFCNAQLVVPIKVILEELGQEQLTTPLIIDNSTAAGFSNKQIKQKHSKSWHTRHHCIHNKVGEKIPHKLGTSKK